MATLGVFTENLDLFDPRTPYAGDERTPVEFYMGTIPADQATSDAAGHPVFLDVESIRIYNSKDNILDRPVETRDKQRWARAYAAWKSTGATEPGGGGWKLETWPQMSRAQVEEFKYFKIFTVEQLATMPDSTGQGIHGFQNLRARAKAALALANEEAPLLQMTAALEMRDAKISHLESEIQKLMKLVGKLTKEAA